MLLPSQIWLQILVESVKLRTLGRALRLQLVSKSFSAWVEEAISASGMLLSSTLKDSISTESAPFFRRYIQFCVPRLHPMSPTFVWAVHLPTEAVVGETSAKDANETKTQIIALFVGKGSSRLRHLSDRGKMDEECLSYKRMLLSVAAYLKQRPLVYRLLRDNSIFGQNIFDEWERSITPVQAAAYGGDRQIVVDILRYPGPDFRYEPGSHSIYEGHKRNLLAVAAAQAGDEALIYLALGPIENFGVDRLRHDMDSVWMRTSTKISDGDQLLKYYEKWFQPQFEDAAKDESSYRDHFWNQKWRFWLERELLVRSSEGNIGVIRSIDGLGVCSSDFNGEYRRDPCPDGARCKHPVALAAQRGHSTTVQLLLDLGTEAHHTFETACKVGVRSILRLLLAICQPPSETIIQRGFVHAVTRENTDLASSLQESFSQIDEQTRTVAASKAEELGLESMIEFVRTSSPKGGLRVALQHEIFSFTIPDTLLLQPRVGELLGSGKACSNLSPRKFPCTKPSNETRRYASRVS